MKKTIDLRQLRVSFPTSDFNSFVFQTAGIVHDIANTSRLDTLHALLSNDMNPLRLAHVLFDETIGLTIYHKDGSDFGQKSESKAVADIVLAFFDENAYVVEIESLPL